MGLLDRFRKTVANSPPAEAMTASSVEKQASDLLEEGMALEKEQRLEEALRRYDEATQLMPQLARAHFLRGTILLDQGSAKPAIEAFLNAIKFKPDSAAAHFNLGNAYAVLKQFDAAIRSYEHAIALKSDFADALFALGGVLEGQGELDLAAKQYRLALQIAPDYAEVHCNLGDVLRKTGKLTEAETCYAAAVRIDSSNAEFCFRHGSALHELEQHALAELRYLAVLKIQPNHAEACHNLGSLLVLQKRLPEAATFFQRALISNPQSAETWVNLGVVQRNLHQLDEAIGSYRCAIAINPNYPDAHLGLAKVLHDAGRIDEAVMSVTRALEADPENADAHLELGMAFQELKRFQDAQKSYRRALQIRPDFPEAYNNLGAIHKELSEFDAASECFQKAIALRPDFAEAHNNLGSMFQVAAKYDEAAKCFERALELKPDFAEAHLCYGSVWQHIGRFDRAEQEYRRAIELKPNLAEAYSNLGVVLNRTRRFVESLACYRRALEIRPDYVTGLVNISHTMKDMFMVDDAIASLQRALALDPDSIQAHHNLLFVQNYLGQLPSEQMLIDAKRFGDVATRRAQPYTSWPNAPLSDRRIRVGMVSGDLCHHPVGFFLEGVLKALTSKASERIEVIAYPSHICNDEVSRRIQSYCAGWHSAMGLSDAAFSQRIRDDEIDILIDLSGHSGKSSLSTFAWKPAPIQVTWLGYFATTGLAAIDHLLADPWTLPPSEEVFFTEKIWRLPETRLCFTPPDVAVNVSPLPALSNGYITFACFNNLSKMNDTVVATWVRVLNAVPNSRLYIKAQLVAEPSLRQQIAEKFTSRGIEAHRLILEDYASREDYLTAHHRVDISLDPFPFPGGTTTVESLWMGVPVLTLSGQHFLSRQGLGLLTNAGLTDWIATDIEDYVARATAFARDIQGLAALRARLRQQVLASPIYDTERFAAHFEDAMRGMWKTWCAQTLGTSAAK